MLGSFAASDFRSRFYYTYTYLIVINSVIKQQGLTVL